MRKTHIQTAQDLLEQYRQGLIIKEQALEGLTAIINSLHDDVELLLFRAEEVRQAQRYYFINRNDTNKKISMARESHLDSLITHFKRKGYMTEVQKLQAAKQKKMF